MRTALYYLCIITALLSIHTPEKAAASLKNPVMFIWNIAKQHPFLIAAIIVILSQEDPWHCIKDRTCYLFEEYPLVSIIVLGLLLGGYYQELSDLLALSNTVLRYTMRILSRVFSSSRRVFG